jgi:uncharacterized protein YkwD
MRGIFLIILISISSNLNSTELQRYDNEINAFNPNYSLINEGLFRATNEIRVENNLPEFEKDPLLQKVAESHAYQMIYRNFYDHQNPYDSKQKKLPDRVEYVSGHKNEYYSLAENIANYDILDTETMFCIKKLPNGSFYYYNCTTKQRMPLLTYKGLARLVVKGWMKSPGHRANLLNKKYKYLGTAARLSNNPYTTAAPPFARLVQDFGG